MGSERHRRGVLRELFRLWAGTSSTSATPFIEAESMTPMETKTKFRNTPGKSRWMVSSAWMPSPA